MSRSILCSIFVVAIAALSAPLQAQEVAVSVPVPVVMDSQPVGPAIEQPIFMLAAPASMAEMVTVGVTATAESSFEIQTQEAAGGGIKNFFFGTQRRTSNTLMIGGVAFAGIGVGVVKGEVGALMGVVGLLASIGGLYLAF